jgi:hypothetical protein
VADDFVVLAAEVASERSEWEERWARSPFREPSAHPRFLEVLSPIHSYARCAVLSRSDDVVMFAFSLRKISDLPWVDRSLHFDATGPKLGYSGPFTSNMSLETAQIFWEKLDRWAESHRVVSLFARLSLAGPDVLPYVGDRRHVQDAVIRQLAGYGDAELWRDIDHKVRKNVNRAHRDGIAISISSGSSEAIDQFLPIYAHTMERRGVGLAERIDRETLEALVDGIPECSRFFFASRGGELVSAEMILVSAKRVYSFLGGTLDTAYRSRPNDLLKFEIMKWARGEGYEDFVLGGGASPDDGIFRYKRAFAAAGVVPFYAAERCWDGSRCEELLQMRRAYEGSHAAGWCPNPLYFPAYRSS